MKYSIIIPCYNEAGNLERLLGRICFLQKTYDLEFILVENGSKDKSREYFEVNIEGRYEGIKVIYVNENLGYGYGIQQGIKAADGEYIGWIHADLQVPPEELIPFFEVAGKFDGTNRVFMKGRRTNRSAFDRFFTNAQSVLNSCLFRKKLNDVGAIPVLFHRSLIEDIWIDTMPNDFSIELYVYLEAVKRQYDVIRLPVRLLDRKKGTSSWDYGLLSKIRQSRRIFQDSLKIKRGEKVL